MITRRLIGGIVLMAAALGVAACGGSGSDGDGRSGSTGATSTSAASDRPLDGAKIAVLVPALSNSYQTAEVNEIKARAAAAGASVDVFDGAFDPQKQYAQFQDAITTGRYKAILVSPFNGPAIASLVPRATKAGIVVGGFNTPIGADYETNEPSTPGVSFQVLRAMATSGSNSGKLVAEACADKDPCRVGYLFIQKGSPPDVALRDGFDEAVRGTGVEIVAEGNSQASRTGTLKAMQDILTAHRDIDVVAGMNVSPDAARQAIAKAGLGHDVAIVSISGSRQAAKAVDDGTFYGIATSVPATEGGLAVDALAKAMATGEELGGIDPVVAGRIPGEGRITKANVTEFRPEYDE